MAVAKGDVTKQGAPQQDAPQKQLRVVPPTEDWLADAAAADADDGQQQGDSYSYMSDEEVRNEQRRGVLALESFDHTAWGCLPLALTTPRPPHTASPRRPSWTKRGKTVPDRGAHRRKSDLASVAVQVEDAVLDAATFIGVMDDVRPLSPELYNPFVEVWARIARIPPEERYRCVCV